MSDSSEYQFIDTNVLVYAHDLSAGAKHTKANELIQDLWKSETGCLSVQVLQEFYVSVTQKVLKPLDKIVAARIIRDLSYLRVHSPEPKDVLGAIDLQNQYHISFWDAMVIRSATQLGCQLILSEDLNPGQVYQGIKLVNPFES